MQIGHDVPEDIFVVVHIIRGSLEPLISIILASLRHLRFCQSAVTRLRIFPS